MKVLFYNHTSNVSGAERVLLLALKRIDRNVIEPRVVCPEGDLANECESLGLPVRTVRELNARFTLRPERLVGYFISLLATVRELRKEILDAGVDAVHANSVRAGIAALFATFGTGHIVWWHVHDELKPHPISTAIRLLLLATRRCRVIAVSEATAKSFTGLLLRGLLEKRPVMVVHNAADLKDFDADEKNLNLRGELGLAADSFLFGIVGQITPRKGQLELVKTFAKAVRQMPSAKLLIVGKPIFNDDTEYDARVVAAVRELGLTGSVLFLGHRSDALAIMANLDALVVNSNSEAFVMVAIEAMACGTPVIATDVGGTREMIEDGFNGWLLKPGDDVSLAGTLVTAYGEKNTRQLFARRSQEIFERRLNADRFIAEFQSALVSTFHKRLHSHGLAAAVLKARVVENQ